MALRKWLGLLSMLSAPVIAAQPLLLTGEVSSPESQVVVAPKTDRWQVMIQWMPDEGQVVEKGELVTVFDSGGIQTKLEQNQQELEMQMLELKKIEMDLNQAVVEAQGKLELAKISVNKARIEASVEDGDVSAFDKGKYQIAYEKALMEQLKAEEALKLAEQARLVGIQKQKINILQTEEDIAYQSSQLEKMSVKALVTGPVSYMPHPWDGNNKITAGTNVQAAWSVLTVQAQSGYQVTAWIHEIDAARIDLAGMDIQLSLDAYPGKTYPGTLMNASKQAEARAQWSDSAYYKLLIGFEQLPEVMLSPGMSVRVMLTPKSGASS